MSGESTIAQAVALGSYFLSGCLAINTSQVLGAPLYLVNEDWYNAWISFTKQSFNLLTITLTQWWAPTTVRVSGDPSMRGQLFKNVEGNLMCNFPERLVMIANHQIYTDWLYLWWVAYCAGAAGRFYIVLKESLKRIPVIGWGIQLSQFILLKRNWEKDKPHLSKHLQKLNNHDPMWLLLFPEGTNLAPSTRASSQKWAVKNNIPDMQHTLHPRTTGLQFCLQELRHTVGYLYDCTIAYEGVPRGQYAQDIYTLQAQYLQGKPPDKVHMYWRRFRISDIPIDNTKSFESWLRARWIEKDAYIEHYYLTGEMPCDRGLTTMPDGTKRKGCGYIETTIKATAWHEFLQVFAPIGALSLILYTFYNQLPKDFVSSVNGIGKKAIMDKAKSIGQSFGDMQKTLTTYPGGPTITFNSNKISNKQAAGIMHKVTKQLTAQKPEELNTVLPGKMAPNISNLAGLKGSVSAPMTRRGSVNSVPSSMPRAGPKSVSGRSWETVSNSSSKPIPKLPKAPSTSTLPKQTVTTNKAPIKKVSPGGASTSKIPTTPKTSITQPSTVVLRRPVAKKNSAVKSNTLPTKPKPATQSPKLSTINLKPKSATTIPKLKPITEKLSAAPPKPQINSKKQSVKTL